MKRNLVGKILGKIKIFVQDFVPVRTALTVTVIGSLIFSWYQLPLYRDITEIAIFAWYLFGWERDNVFQFEWGRNNAIYLATVKMGMVIPISYGNLQITNYRGKYRGILPW